MRRHAQEIDRDRGGLARWLVTVDDGAAFGTAPAFEENATFFLEETPSLSLRLRSVPSFSRLAKATRTKIEQGPSLFDSCTILVRTLSRI
jgi:hypothetical protein